MNRWNGPGQSPVTTGNPASWAGAPPNANAAAAAAAAAGWQGQGMAPRTAGPRQHQPHPDIDGRADDSLRWSANNTADAVVQRGWQAAPSEGNTTMANSTENGGPVVRYSVDESGRPIQVRILGPNMRYMMGSNQSSSTAWSPAQGNARPPWVTQSMNNPTGVPLDGRIQTPGGTGAMGGHAAAAAAAAAATARPPTATGQMSGPYSATGPPGYTAYANRPGSVQGQPRPGGDYPGGPGAGPGPSGPGGEIPYGSQPDSMAAYRQNNAAGAPAAGMPPPASSATPGAGGPGSQGYAMAGGGPLPTGNPYPAVPPATGAQPYGMPRSGVISQPGGPGPQQMHHQQPPPGAPGNMYPNIYAMHPGQPPSQANGSVYAPYSTVGGAVSYPMNQGAPMGRPMTRMVPVNGPGGMQVNAYGQMVGHHPQASQEMYARMAQGPAGAGGMDGYRPPQQQH